MIQERVATPVTSERGGHRRARPHHQRGGVLESRQRSPRLVALGQVLALLAVWDLLLALRGLWPAQVLLLLVAVVLPGFLSLRAIGVAPTDMARSPAWLVGAGLVTVTAIGVAVDVVGHAAGVARPLRLLPLVAGFHVVVLLLTAVRGRWDPWTAVTAVARDLDGGIGFLVLPVLAVVGALRLNATGQPQIAVVGAVAALITLAWGFLVCARWPAQRLMWLLYGASTTFMLGYSLRSEYIFGWDISAEFGLLRETIDAGYWAPSHPGDAYGAMLSLTVLPSTLHAITSIDPLVIFKLVYPLIFGLFPLALYVLVRSVLPARAAFLGASVLLTLLSFQQEMPALARQEIALLLFVGLLAAVLDDGLATSARLALITLLGSGMAVSHYSTTYAAVTLLLGAVLVQAVVALWHPAPVVDVRKLVALVVTVVAAMTWYAGLTQSTSNVASVASGLVDSGLEILPNARSGNLLERYLLGNIPEPVSAEQYQQGVAARYAVERPWVVQAPDAGARQWRLRDATPPQPATPRRSPPASEHLVDLAVLWLAQLLNLLAVVGTLGLVLWPRTKGALFDVAVFAVPAVALLGAIRLSSTLAGEYGPQRLLVQLLPILAVPMLWMLTVASRLVRRVAAAVPGAWAHRVAAAGLAGAVLAFFGTVLVGVSASSGLTAALSGDRSSANLFNGGDAYERFAQTRGEVVAARWLGVHQDPRQPTYADLYGQLRLFAFGRPGHTLLTDLAPQTIDANAWVFGSRANVVDGRARASFDASTVLFIFPKSFLEREFGVVYSNDEAEVYHR